MPITYRLLMEARYIISLNKQIKDLVPILHVSKEIIDYDIYYRMKEFDKELFYRVMSVLEKKSS